eukprot:99531-Rhodomonas_salina.2
MILRVCDTHPGTKARVCCYQGLAAPRAQTGTQSAEEKGKVSTSLLGEIKAIRPQLRALCTRNVFDFASSTDFCVCFVPGERRQYVGRSVSGTEHRYRPTRSPVLSDAYVCTRRTASTR